MVSSIVKGGLESLPQHACKHSVGKKVIKETSDAALSAKTIFLQVSGTSMEINLKLCG